MYVAVEVIAELVESVTVNVIVQVVCEVTVDGGVQLVLNPVLVERVPPSATHVAVYGLLILLTVHTAGCAPDPAVIEVGKAVDVLIRGLPGEVYVILAVPVVYSALLELFTAVTVTVNIWPFVALTGGRHVTGLPGVPETAPPPPSQLYIKVAPPGSVAVHSRVETPPEVTVAGFAVTNVIIGRADTFTDTLSVIVVFVSDTVNPNLYVPVVVGAIQLT